MLASKVVCDQQQDSLPIRARASLFSLRGSGLFPMSDIRKIWCERHEVNGRKNMQRRDNNPNPTPTERKNAMKHFAKFVSVIAVVMFIAALPAQSAQKKVDTSKQQTEQIQPSQSQQKQLNPAAESHDPHWHPSPKKVDLVITQVRITRYPDRGKIGISATIKNIGNKSTTGLIRVAFSVDGTRCFIHGLRAGGTKSTGYLIDDNARRNRPVYPLTVEVNPGGEIEESNTRNNTCYGAELRSSQNRTTHTCSF